MKQIVMGMLCIGLSACTSTSGLDNAERNQFVTEFYATVSAVDEVKFESHAGQAVALGAASGALGRSDGDREDIIGGAIVGGLIGGLFSAIFEGPRKGYEYHLNAVDGDLVTVVLDYHPADVGDCVKVRVAGNVSVKLDKIERCIEEQFD